MAASYDDLRHQEVLPAALEDISQVDVTLEGETYTLTAGGRRGRPRLRLSGQRRWRAAIFRAPSRP